MGILNFIGIGNPLTDYLEEELSNKAVELLKKEGTNIPDNWRNTKGKLKGEISSKIKQMAREQSERVKPHWKEFKGKISQLVREAIITTFAKSKIDNYSYEMDWEIIAVSEESIRKQALDELVLLLRQQIGVADLEYDTITALAKYAFDIKYDEQLDALIDEREIFDVDYRNYVIVEKIKNDRYYINDENASKQIGMIFLSEINKYSASAFTPEDERKKEEIKETKKRVIASFDRWIKFKNKRPNNRRFYSNKWGL